ncbi:dihydrodipicolinate synthase family protein [Caballeronia sp. SEWSISQ10-4 2]|uniref:dihydrodipicolinate synthase family protein n=1 Tax=Caballeronia sp. SEWSISQ10-4 2 TaxID=2937438 RepID=UPI0026556F4F|nr:dihydrodipicolinate synthase family protein [Caballeronia sp. SEWSISQ10-4 2]MDN7179152.1 dihydrodipicolinate synthase family protein [Caballeronia sp. SEWSISQ10-4 2]
MTRLNLLTKSGQPERYTLEGVRTWKAPEKAAFNRVVYSAAHVVADPRQSHDPWESPAIDWDATLRYRERLFGLGLGVAEAMDTAQRGMGLDWPTSLELIRRSVAMSSDYPGALVASGAGTDQLSLLQPLTLEAVSAAYEEQVAAIEAAGGRLILMASRALAAVARSSDDYELVYGKILQQTREPVILHWLGEMFDPALAGYWGTNSVDEAMNICLRVIEQNVGKVDGIKISLLDKEKEVAMRRRLPASVKMYTGDDFNYPELIEGDRLGYSHALLGIFDAIAPAASSALQALAAGDNARFNAILAPTLPLSRHIFSAPTRFYKSGVVFLAWLNNHQNHFTMVGGQQSARDAIHYSELFRLADKAALFDDPALAASRMHQFMAVQGVE